MRHHTALLLFGLFCLSTVSGQKTVYFPVRGVTWPACESVPDQFVQQVRHVLGDSAKRFPEYPEPVPFTCDLLKGLQEAMVDDSVRYHFEHLSQRYWLTDPHYRSVERYIVRHVDFNLSIAATGHFFADVRIIGLKKLQEYRRMRPLVCAEKSHYERLEKQDREAVRYLIHVLENTPWHIDGSENATIHDVYMNEIVQTLDLFTGQRHEGPKDLRPRRTIPDNDLQAALNDWRKWLDR